MNIELLTKFAGFLTEKVTEVNRPIMADFLESFLVVEIEKLENLPEMGELAASHEMGPEMKPITDEDETPVRSGNGHKSLKKRDLTDSEKSSIRGFFTEKNGQIENDACVEYKKKEMDPDVAIFQVTGFVSYLHLQIARGKLRVHDMTAYLEFIGSHRNLWATYNSPKYRAMRRKMGIEDEPDPSSTKDTSSGVWVDIKELTTPDFAL